MKDNNSQYRLPVLPSAQMTACCELISNAKSIVPEFLPAGER